MEMKSQMKEIEKKLLFQEPPQPTVKDSSGLNYEPTSAGGTGQSLPAAPSESNLDTFIEELELENAVFGFNNTNETTGGFVLHHGHTKKLFDSTKEKVHTQNTDL